MTRVARWLLTSAVVALGFCPIAHATPGDPDVDFGGTGTVDLSPAADSEAFGVAVDSANRVLIVGQGQSSAGYLERLRVDGGADSTFSDPFGPTTTPGVFPSTVVPLSRNDMAVGGLARNQVNVWAIAHVTAAGALDQGIAEVSMGGVGTFGEHGVQDIVVQADGDPVVAGTAGLGLAKAIGLVRSNPEYSFLDLTFSSDGKVVEEVPGATDSVETGLACATPGSVAKVCAPGSKLLGGGPGDDRGHGQDCRRALQHRRHPRSFVRRR